MGMFDTVYAELDCPFCGKQYRYTPMTWEDAESKMKQHKQWEVESRQRHLRGEKVLFSMQEYWAERDGFDDVDAWIAQLDTPDKIEAHRTRRQLGKSTSTIHIPTVSRADMCVVVLELHNTKSLIKTSRGFIL